MKGLMIIASALSLGISGAALAAPPSNAPAKSATASTTETSGHHMSGAKARTAKHAKVDCTKTADKDKPACRR